MYRISTEYEVCPYEQDLDKSCTSKFILFGKTDVRGQYATYTPAITEITDFRLPAQPAFTSRRCTISAFSVHVARSFFHGSGSFQHVRRSFQRVIRCSSIYRTTCPRAKKDLRTCILLLRRVVLIKIDLGQTKEPVCIC